MQAAGTDRAIRAISDEGAYRVVAVRSAAMVQQVLDAQGVTGPEAERFGELLTAAVLVRETMAPDKRVQVMVNHREWGQLLADSHPEGMTRGLAQLRDERPPQLPRETVVQVVRVLLNGELHQGVVETAPEESTSELLARYFAVSEQVTSWVGVCCALGADGRVAEAGGWVIQLLPEASDEDIVALGTHVSSLAGCDALLRESGGDADGLLERLFDARPHTRLADSPVVFGCTCSPMRMLTALTTIGRADLEAIVEEGQPVTLHCDYCGTDHTFGIEQLRPLLDRQ